MKALMKQNAWVEIEILNRVRAVSTKIRLLHNESAGKPLLLTNIYDAVKTKGRFRTDFDT
jgi:hypothetical protein